MYYEKGKFVLDFLICPNYLVNRGWDAFFVGPESQIMSGYVKSSLFENRLGAWKKTL